jgi:hypothetical protein
MIVQEWCSQGAGAHHYCDLIKIYIFQITHLPKVRAVQGFAAVHQFRVVALKLLV